MPEWKWGERGESHFFCDLLESTGYAKNANLYDYILDVGVMEQMTKELTPDYRAVVRVPYEGPPIVLWEKRYRPDQFADKDISTEVLSSNSHPHFEQQGLGDHSLPSASS